MIGKVVEVAVGQPQSYHVPPARGGFLEQGAGGMVRRVKQHRLPGCLIRNQVAIGHRNPAGVRQYDHAGRVYAPGSRTASTASRQGEPNIQDFDCQDPVAEAQIPLDVTQASVRENAGMSLIEQIKACIFSHGSMVVIAVIGILALILAIKIAHVIIRMIFALLGLAAIGTAVWWFFLRQ
jgi:hypothetical protein